MDIVWVIKIENNIDGEIYFSVAVCETEERAIQELHALVDDVRERSYHFKGFDERDDFEIEQMKDYFYINDPSDDYYIEMMIQKVNVLK